MEQYVVELSKYFTALFMALYAFECFSVFRFEKEEDRSGIYIRQNILMFIIHLTCYISIILKGGRIEYIFFFAFQQIALFSVIVLFHMVYPRANRLLVNNMCMLLSIGFVILTRLSYKKAVKQFLIAVAALLLMMFVPYLVQKLQKAGGRKAMKWVAAGIGILSLGAVLILGAVTNGSKLSFSVAGISFQPSEFVKILFVFCAAGFLCTAEKLWQLALSALIAGIHVIILVLSRDLGSALIFFVVYVIMLFCATKQKRYLCLGAVFGCIAAAASYHIFSHVQVRVQAWQNPWDVIEGTGFQIAQSLFAINSGGWFGMGLCQGSPGSIPFVETDFVFAAIVEELGAIYGICLILICLSCFMMFMNIAMQLKDKFSSLIAIGLGTIYVFQIFLTIGGGTKFIPLTGVTLPLISYGGSSVIATVLMFAIVEGFYLAKPTDRKKRASDEE